MISKMNNKVFKNVILIIFILNQSKIIKNNEISYYIILLRNTSFFLI